MSRVLGFVGELGQLLVDAVLWLTVGVAMALVWAYHFVGSRALNALAKVWRQHGDVTVPQPVQPGEERGLEY